MNYVEEQRIIEGLKSEMKLAFEKFLKEISTTVKEEEKDYEEYEIFHSSILPFSDAIELLNLHCPLVSDTEQNGWEADYSVYFKDKDNNYFSATGCGYYGGMTISYCYNIDETYLHFRDNWAYIE